jgi:hypothetical protein
MLKIVLKMTAYFLCLIALGTCIDPYNPHLGKYNSLLVMEGMITDEKIPSEVTLSRTFQSIDSVPVKVSDAVVYITDEDGNTATLNYSGNGKYKTDSALFHGTPGKTYTLHIQTSDGNKYESEPCVMTPVTGIDSVYYAKDEVVNSTLNTTVTGIGVYLDSDEEIGGNTYFRWEYEEIWKFQVPSQKKYNYINDRVIIPLTNVSEYCWKSNKSGGILIGSVLPGLTDSIKKMPVTFIQPDQSDRLTIQYSILVRQMSVTKKEFDFWSNLKQVNEIRGSIYDTQPYSVISNIYNVDNPDERVLGYFSVSAVKEKRIYILPKDIYGMGLPQFNYDCQEYERSPSDYMPNPATGKAFTFDEIYDMFMAAGGLIFVRPIYTGQNQLYKLVFVPVQCSDCSLTGSVSKPDFWTDLP